jgi:diguanylate cyclase (GGDEF)-like protein/PAS domain S-box-containing protein
LKAAGTLLVVDDNEANRDALSRRLELKGYTVKVASGGWEALGMLEAGAYDLVLLDVEMPGMSGFDVIGRLRNRWSAADLPVIMVTARSDGADVVEAFRLGANDYVTKPIDFPVVLARLSTQLGHKRAIAALRESEERYALALRGANDGLWDWNLVNNRVHWSARWKAMLGYGDEEIGASPDEWLNRVHPDDRTAVQAALDAHLSGSAEYFESEHRVLHRAGSYRWVRCRGAAVRSSEGTATRLAGSLTDVTEAKVFDALTGLPNRFLFVDLIDRAIKRTHRRHDHVFALLAVGLDRFSMVADSAGPAMADRLLVAIGQRLQAGLRCTDIVTPDDSGFTVARLGGEEFTILLDDVAGVDAAVRVAERLRAAIDAPFDIDGQQLFVEARIGLAVSTSGYVEPEQILRDAATALNRARAEGAAGVEIFDPAMRERAVARLRLETDLRKAVEAREFEVFYQPIVSLVSGKIVAFEALSRWRHPERGIVGPAEFIALAEETGLIMQIGRSVLSDACGQLAAWRRTYGDSAPEAVCVNVSSRQFLDAELPDIICGILAATGLSPSNLKLEVTESVLIGDIRVACATVARLQRLGIEWSLDDFGTGYSSLSYLHQLQVDTVKVDRSFVNRMGDNGDGAEMVRAIVELGHNLGMDVVAEGVETEAQLKGLRALGCEFCQGFLFSRPVEAAVASVLIATQPMFEPAVA